MTDINGNPIEVDDEEGNDETAPGENPPAIPEVVGLPGPHPHEASDLRLGAGDINKQEDPMEGYRDE